MTSCPEIDDYLCRILRGEQAVWPPVSDKDFAQSFLDRAMHHGVQALVYDLVSPTAAWQGWPEDLRHRLQEELRAAVAYDLLRSHCIPALLGELQRRNIKVLITKGEALARMVYKNPALRVRCDTDLFIDLKDIERVRSAFVDSGYTIIPPIYKSHQFMGVKALAGSSIVVDLHWRILNAPQFARAISFNEAYRRSVPLPGMSDCRTLNRVDALLLACMHLKGSEFHEEGRLIWLYDIHLFFSAMTQTQQRDFAQKAVDIHVQQACLDCMLASTAQLHTEVSSILIETLANAQQTGSISRRYAASNLALLLDDLRELPDTKSRAALFRELFFPSPESLLGRYGKTSRVWLPLLYLNQLVGGISRRLSLR